MLGLQRQISKSCRNLEFVVIFLSFELLHPWFFSNGPEKADFTSRKFSVICWPHKNCSVYSTWITITYSYFQTNKGKKFQQERYYVFTSTHGIFVKLFIHESNPVIEKLKGLGMGKLQERDAQYEFLPRYSPFLVIVITLR